MLKDDTRAIFSASARATEAAQFLEKLGGQVEATEDGEEE